MLSELLDGVLLQPLLLIYEYLFNLPPDTVGAGWRLVAFSVALNLILVPVYNQMERRSSHTREMRERVGRDVARMKRHFKGRERYFYIRAVHRQHAYHPISDLLGSADLLVQIAVFATVYRFLSGFDGLSGVSFGPIRDLSLPDGLLWGANLLPLLMTAANAASVITYTGDKPKQLQALALGLLFLGLLYNSSAGLVLYWTTNNLFSLVRSLTAHRLRSRVPLWLTRLRAELAVQR